jgi:hypothetical protein
VGGGRRPRGFLISPWGGSWEKQIAAQTGRDRHPWDDPPPRPTVVRGVHVSAELKAAAYGSLRALIHRGWLLLPASAHDLIRELLTLRVTITDTGMERIETGGKDLASGLMLALGPYHGNGEFGTSLRRIAEHAANQPAAVVPPEVLALPAVTTGDGVRVPRVPAWESVDGSSALSLPPGAAAAEADSPSGAAAHPRSDMEAMRERVRAVLNQPPPRPHEEIAK